MTIKFRDWIIVAEMLSSSREELDIDLCKIVGIFLSHCDIKKNQKMQSILSNYLLKNSVDNKSL